MYFFRQSVEYPMVSHLHAFGVRIPQFSYRTFFSELNGLSMKAYDFIVWSLCYRCTSSNCRALSCRQRASVPVHNRLIHPPWATEYIIGGFVFTSPITILRLESIKDKGALQLLKVLTLHCNSATCMTSF